ncbi:MAG: protein kinase domain-containing protein [Planctomycetota bacterium]|jgi:serine/threonine protein kinase
MGLLWTVTDAHTGHRYALKTLRPERRSDALVEAFRREAQTWIALGRHEHVVQALWLVDEAPGPFLVLEFVPGRNLADVVSEGPLELARALDLALQCASGLVYAHARRVGEGVGVVHRDIKPSNLLVTADDREFGRLGLPDRHPALRDLAGALADAGSVRPARIALYRADRGDRRGRVASRALRARLALKHGDLRRARGWVERAERHAGRSTGHAARIAASVVLAEVALRDGALQEARRAADVALAFARAQGDPFAAAAAERVLLELAGRAGRPAEAVERAHRAARAYTGRADVGDGPARLLAALGRGLAEADPRRAQRFLRAARRCYDRLEAQGFRPPESLLTAS